MSRLRIPLLVLAVSVLAGCFSSREKLLADLQSPAAHERAAAVRKLAQDGRAEDLVLFTRAAKDLAAIVRGEAAEALGKSEDPRVVDLLGELLEDDDEDVQSKAAQALARIKDEKSKSYLTLQYGRRSGRTRLAIVQALKSANVPGAMAQVVAAEGQGIWNRNLRALKDGSLPERVAAAEELGKSGRAEAVTRLLPLTRDSQVILAAAAVRGLGYAGDPRAVPDIAALLAENYPDLREAATEALQHLGDPQALPTLKAVALEKSATSSLAIRALLALPTGPATDQALCEIVMAADERDVLVAGRALRTRGRCELQPLIERLTRNRDVTTALVAIRALGPAAKEAAPKLMPYLTSNDRALRKRAVEAAAEVGDTSLGAAVQKIYEDELKVLEGVRADWVSRPLPDQPSPGFATPPPPGAGSQEQTALKQSELFRRVEQANAARAEQAGRLQIKTPPPSEIVDDASPEQLELLAAAIEAAAALKIPDAMAIAKRHATESSAILRAAAHRALARLGGEGLDAAAHGLIDHDRDVQAAAAEALASVGAPGQAKIFEVLPKLPGDRLRVLEALVKVPAVDRAGTDALLTVLKEGGPETAYAARLLGRLKAPGAVEPLIQYLQDPTAPARRDALWALGQIGDKAAAEVVGKDLYHDSPDVRADAAAALAAIGTDKQHEPLDALKGDYYRRVREAADTALSRLGAVAEPQK